MSPQKTTESESDNLLDSIYTLSLSAISDAIAQSARAIAVELYKSLEQTSDWLRADYSVAINLLEANDEWFAARISSSVKDAFKGKDSAEKCSEAVAQSNTGLTSASLSNLSLVSKDEFEDWLTANVAVKYLEAELSYELYEVRLILGFLNRTIYDNKDCPLSPNILFRSLKSSIEMLEIPTTPQAMIYKLFSRQLVQPLRSLYKSIMSIVQKVDLAYKPLIAPLKKETASSLKSHSDTHTKNKLNENNYNQVPDVSNDDFTEAEEAFAYDEHLGLNPSSGSQHLENKNLANKQIGNKSSAGHSHKSSGINMLGQDSSSSVKSSQARVVNSSVNTLNTLSSLNARITSGGSLRQTDQSPSPEDSAYLISAISQLQQAHIQADNLGDQKLRAWIETGLNDCPDVKCDIGNQDFELIDVTDRFFEVVIDKVGVSGLLRKWLEKLKVTILKVVLRDKTFFSDVSHPARQMLNKLAKLASSDRADHKRLEKVLDRFIDRVIVEYDDDERAVEKILAELDQLLERQALAHKRNSERIARAYEGKQKVADARYKVIKDISNLLSGVSVPVVILELLDKAGWREHLALVSVRDGHDSEQYEEVFKVIDLLLSWLGDESDHSDKWAIELEMELEAPSLIDLIKKELSVSGLIGYDSIVKHLEDCLFNDAQSHMVKVDHYEWPFDKAEKEIQDLSPDQKLDAQVSYWHKRILSMKVGDWLEIKDEQGKAKCMRLAWSGRSSFRFVFVDSQGMKDEDVTLDQLVEFFKNNRASFVEHEDVPLVDQGLHQMVQSVYEELATQSSCDVLTGLLSRQAFERALQQSISGAITKKTKAALLYIDLDKFSITNASYGHHAGDGLLKHVAQLIKTETVDDAYCGRLGGNEFGVILNQCSLEASKDIARQICESVEKNVFTWDKHSIKSTVSIGVADFNIEIDSSDTLMRKAGLACESAKNQGRNRVVHYQEKDDDQRKRLEMLEWVNCLDEDLDDLLTLRCQEIRPIDIDGVEKPHYEILLGVKKNGQILPPGLLIEAAEHFNRMAKVDRWVVHNVLSWLEENQSLAAKASGFSINLSGNSLNDDHFLEFLLGQFAVSSVPPEMICFEITETAAITNLSDATEFIRVLKQTGCKFALDDFGSGMSSYAYIQKLPVDYIKIDGIFIRNIANNVNDQALVKSINELAHFMGMKTVAEFVESHEILAVLREIGVDHSQGFGIKKPTLLEELGSYIR
jgi:diguanylate cyclase (GGDEF)-like protein